MADRDPDAFETAGDAAGDAASDDAPPAERDPDISELDRFFVNGRAMPFADWVQSVMAPIPPREPEASRPQPAPEAADVVWMSRRPVD